MSTHGHRAAKSDGMIWVPKKNLKKHHEQKKRAVDLNATQQMAIDCRNNYFSHLVPRLEEKKESINIPICGKKIYYCVKSRIFCSSFQNRVKHWKSKSLFLNQSCILIKQSSIYWGHIFLPPIDAYMYRVWCCSENHLLNVSSNTIREKRMEFFWP